MMQLNPAYLHNNGQDALFATVTPLNPGITVPYWCNNFSAYNNSAPSGTISLSDPAFQSALPVAAKYSAGSLINDIRSGSPAPLESYGTVFNAGGKIIQYDPSKMGAQITLKPASDVTTTDLNPVGQRLANDLNNPLSSIEKRIAENPVISVGILLAVFGISAIISSK